MSSRLNEGRYFSVVHGRLIEGAGGLITGLKPERIQVPPRRTNRGHCVNIKPEVYPSKLRIQKIFNGQCRRSPTAHCGWLATSNDKGRPSFSSPQLSDEISGLPTLWLKLRGLILLIFVAYYLCLLQTCVAVTLQKQKPSLSTSTASAPQNNLYEKYGRLTELSTSKDGWGYRALKNEAPSTKAIDNIKQRSLAFQGRFFLDEEKPKKNKEEFEQSKAVNLSSDRSTSYNVSFFSGGGYRAFADPNEEYVTAYRRLVEELLDPHFYEKTVHPKRNYSEPTRVNLSMSLYQILDVNEPQQSIMVNVWMVQDWYDEFLDWNPLEYEMINKTIVPYTELWIPDTCLYNSETLEQKRTEALMNAIVETGYWRGDGRGAAVQLMFPAIYTLSCRMNVRFFPYDQQNCSFIISSWTHDKSTIDYHAKVREVNMKNFARNEEWTVVSFEFVRIEQMYKCCPQPWVMIYAHLIIRRKPLYYIINLVIPTSIITIVAVTGFFTPSSTSSERDEKLYLGINTLLTMSIMMLMVCNQMPSTSTYVPLMSWYYMGIIFVIVFGTLLATVVLFIHSYKACAQPLPSLLRRLCTHRWLWIVVLEPPANLTELWTEYGVISETRADTEHLDPLLVDKLAETNNTYPDPIGFLSSISSHMSASSGYHYERRIASVTKQYAQQIRDRELRKRRRRETLADAVDFLSGGISALRRGTTPVAASMSNSRMVKRQKMMRRCSLEWEYLANVIDRFLLTAFSFITLAFFFVLVAFDTIFEMEYDNKF